MIRSTTYDEVSFLRYTTPKWDQGNLGFMAIMYLKKETYYDGVYSKFPGGYNI